MSTETNRQRAVNKMVREWYLHSCEFSEPTMSDLNRLSALIIDAITAAVDEKEQSERTTIYNKTCVHHNDAERAAITCPVCLQRKLDEKEEERDLNERRWRQRRDTLQEEVDSLRKFRTDAVSGLSQDKMGDQLLKQLADLQSQLDAAQAQQTPHISGDYPPKTSEELLKVAMLSHFQWAEYFEKNPEAEKDYVKTGEWDDAKTHRRMAEQYQEIITTLEALKNDRNNWKADFVFLVKNTHAVIHPLQARIRTLEEALRSIRDNITWDSEKMAVAAATALQQIKI